MISFDFLRFQGVTSKLCDNAHDKKPLTFPGGLLGTFDKSACHDTYWYNSKSNSLGKKVDNCTKLCYIPSVMTVIFSL